MRVGSSKRGLAKNPYRYLISLDPVTVECYRNTETVGSTDGVFGPKARNKAVLGTLVSTFEGRIDYLKQRYRDLQRSEMPGRSLMLTWTLLVEKPVDRLGRTIDVNEEDRLKIGSTIYRVIYVDNSYPNRYEILIEDYQ